jgi:DNA polymerase I-like protein with 3'-5' exonuclease and polymerase domains
MTEANALFLGTFADKPYLPHLKHMFGGVPTYTITEPVDTLTQLELYCAKRNVTRVVSTNTGILSKLLSRISGSSSSLSSETSSPSLSDYSGSLFTHKGIDIVFVDPLAQLVTVPHGKFITARWISKVISPHTWAESTPFSWTFCDTPSTLEDAYNDLSTAFAIAEDIETFKHNLAIRCVGFTGIFVDYLGNLSTHSYVIPINSGFNLAFLRKINALQVAKIFQNGKYDNAYLLRYNAAPANWLWDTAHLFHSHYSELPKDLAFLNAFHLRKVVYWKDLAETNDLFEYYKYNALDSWATANVWIQQMLSMPDWARHNYFLEFPLVYPCLLSELTGLRRDAGRLDDARRACDDGISLAESSLRNILKVPTFNAASHVQVKALLKILTGKDWDSSDEKNLEKAAYMHPLNRVIIDKILKIRELKKIKGTYLRTDDDIKRNKDGSAAAASKGSKDYKGFWLYSLNPHGTDTGRLASGEHQFWCGANIQNVPRDSSVKSTITTFTGFRLAECDLEQAESRDTAHIAGSEPLIAAVSGSKDFHSVNASSFFGTPYDDIYDDTSRKTKNKTLRDLAKRVNHGANYYMGPGVLVDTMGEKNIWEAARILKLRGMSAKEVAEFLLAQFHRTYPELKRDYYASVIHEIVTTRRLVSRAFHHLESPSPSPTRVTENIERGDWTRYCFGNPDKNKLDLNSYVAHCPQSLNARTLNEAYMKVFYEVALPNPTTFRLHAQIHDSILFSFADERKDHAEAVRRCMEIPVSVRGVDGRTRKFVVPVAIKAGPKGDGVKYWSDTE